jgi:arsenate reductase
VLTVYQYPKCSTCRKALAWLDAHGVEHERVDITLAPPSARELSRVLKVSGLPVAKLFNTSGQHYRAGNFKARLKTLSDTEALAELAANGKLIKRPLVVAPELTLVGFDDETYAAHLAALRASARGRA